MDSLWDCAGPRLRDWETISTLLLEESSAGGMVLLGDTRTCWVITEEVLGGTEMALGDPVRNWEALG